MRRLLYFLLITGLIWGCLAIMLLQNSHARSSSHLASQSPTIVSVKKSVTPSISHTPTASPISKNQSHAHRSPLVIALTFDDGPSPVFTPQVLSILQRYKVHATFFCIGEWVHLYPGLVKTTFRAGNVIGDHTWSHPDLTRLSPYAIRWQISSASAAIQYATGSPPVLFRPPYGATNASVMNIASQLGMLQILWTVDPRDWARPGVNAIVSNILSHTTNRSIILMHDGGGDRSETVQALPLIISALQQRGFTFVTVPQLLRG